jgi:arylsulfatase A-like enzyme
MNINHSLMGMVLATLTFSAAVASAQAAGSDSPNIIVIMTDDLDERSLQDLPASLMPNFHQVFVEQGMNFKQSFVTNPVCCPSRATYLTGQYSHNNGVLSNIALYERPQARQSVVRIEDMVIDETGLPSGFVALGAVGLLNDSTTFATRLQAAGYTTAHIGKYLNGYGSDARYADLSPAYDPRYVPPGWSQWHGLVDPTTYCMYNFGINHNGDVRYYNLPPGVEESEDLYQTNILTRTAEELLERAQGQQPFFLSVTPLAPHSESCLNVSNDRFAPRVRPAPKYKNTAVPDFIPSAAVLNDDMQDNPPWMQDVAAITDADLENLSGQYKDRLRSLLSVDEMIGRIVAKLKDKQLYDNTILVFTSDNGWLYGEHRLGGKVAAYDEAARVPLYIHYPFAPTPTTDGSLVINNDLAPSILDFAGVPYAADAFDGRSFADLLEPGRYTPWTKRQGFYLRHVHFAPESRPVDLPSYAAVHTQDNLYIETRSETIYFSPPNERLFSEFYSDRAQIDNKLGPADVPLAWQVWADLLGSCKGTSCRQLEDLALP